MKRVNEMAALKQYDKIRLKTGQRGRVIEFFNDGMCLAEVVNEKGGIEIKEIKKNDVKAVIVEVEELITAI